MHHVLLVPNSPSSSPWPNGSFGPEWRSYILNSASSLSAMWFSVATIAAAWYTEQKQYAHYHKKCKFLSKRTSMNKCTLMRLIFSSARLVTFFNSAWNRKLAENKPKLDSQLKTYIWLFFIINLYWKWLNYAGKSYHSTVKRPFVLISLDKWSWNWLESW